MKEDYVQYYQPESIIVHGHWPALRTFCLETCREPLHRWHLQPTFRLPRLDPNYFGPRICLFGSAYDIWIRKYGLQDRMAPMVEQYFNDLDLIADEPSASQDKSVAMPSEPEQ